MNILLFLNNRWTSFAISLLFSLIFTKYYFLFTHEYYEPSSSERMAAFQADQVFQKRIFSIIIAKSLSSSCGLSFDHSLKVICVCTCMCLLFGFKALVRDTARKEFPTYFAYFLFIPVGWNYIALNSIYHAYDLPTLAFFCWGIVFFLQKKFFLFYLTFFVGSFNRESTCFITIAIFALQLVIPCQLNFINLFNYNKTLFIHCLFQSIIWFGIKTFLEHVFRNNPGSFYEETFSMYNFCLSIWRGVPSWPFLDTSTFWGNPRSFLSLFACTWIILPIIWKNIPFQTKKLLWIIPPYLVTAIMYANLMESRVYHEINVVLSVCILSGCINLLDKSQYFNNK